MSHRVRVWILRYGLLAILIGGWLYANRPGGISPLLIPKLSSVLSTFRTLLTDASTWDAIGITVTQMGLAFIFAMTLGLGTGFWCGRSEFRARVVEPILIWGYLVPTVLFFPMLLLWFGLGIWSKVAYATLGAFFPIAYSTLKGFRSIDPKVIRTAVAFGASPNQLDRIVKLGAASPMILSGVRIGVSLVMIAVIFGELLGSFSGLGHELGRAYQTLNPTRTFAIIGIIMIMAAIVQSAADRLFGKRRTY